MKKNTLLVMLAIAISTIILTMCRTNIQEPPTNGFIIGYVYTEVSSSADKVNNKQIFLPDVTVYIKDTTGNIIDSTITDLDGAYKTSILNLGNYTIHLKKSGFINTSYNHQVNYLSNHPGPLKIAVNSDNYLFGKVLLKDSIPALYKNPVFSKFIFTTVEMVGNGQAVHCNIFGEYVLPIANLRTGTIIAKSEQASIQATVNNKKIDLVLPNSCPKIRAINAFDQANNVLLRAGTNRVINLKAEVVDKEQNKLDYTWIPFGNFPGSNFPNSNTAQLAIPNEAGTYVVYLLVTDNYGGYAYKPFSILVNDERVEFSGNVTNLDGNRPIQDANVFINGNLVATTNANGSFSTKVSAVSGERYVVTIEKVGFTLSSKIFHNTATNKDYKLVPTTTKRGNPTREISIQEKEDGYTKFTRQKQRREPAEVRIPKNSIIDSVGNLVTSDVIVSVRAVDLFNINGLMPGDFGALEDGKQKALESFGAIDVQIRDANNPKIKYNIKQTSRAFIKIPTTIGINNPSSAILWDYDEEQGLWLKIGALSNAGNSFTGTTNQFSVLNADVAYDDATCIQLLDNPNHPLFPTLAPGNIIDVVFTIPTTTGVPKIITYENLTNVDLPLVVVRLPANVDITMQVFNNGKGILSSTGNIISNQIIRTGSPIPGPANLNPLPPYIGCTDVYLIPDLPQPAWTPEYPFLAKINNDATLANDYYNAIGANDFNGDGVNNDPITFSQWRQRNGFNDATGNTIRATYFNQGDLGFWRRMHQRTTGNNSAFYVTNFSSDVQAIDNEGAIATVAMEYSPLVSGGQQVTKFYVFNATGQLVSNADLDGGGPKNIPGLCITCHGGALPDPGITTPADLNTFYSSNINAIPKFLPFDVRSFVYSAQSGFSKTDLQPHLRSLNEKVLATNETQAIREFITASYGNNFTDNTLNNVDYNENATVGDWNITTPVVTRGNVVPKEFYLNVVGTSCRTCHIAQSGFYTFNTQNSFNNIFPRAVCGTTKFMPNAKQTMINFWNSRNPHNPDEIEKWLNISNCQ